MYAPNSPPDAVAAGASKLKFLFARYRNICMCPVKHHAHALHPVLACWDSGGWEVQGVGACVVLVGGNARRRFRCNSDR